MTVKLSEKSGNSMWNAIVAEEGWSDATIYQVLIDFIQEKELLGELAAYAAERAERGDFDESI